MTIRVHKERNNHNRLSFLSQSIIRTEKILRAFSPHCYAYIIWNSYAKFKKKYHNKKDIRIITKYLTFMQSSLFYIYLDKKKSYRGNREQTQFSFFNFKGLKKKVLFQACLEIEVRCTTDWILLLCQKD